MTRTRTFRNICVVGNIASGKSTLAELLAAEIPHSAAVLESFERNPFLALYLQDPKRWAFTNAVRYFYDYARVFQARTAGREYRHHFIDAGAPTNRYVYGRYMREEGIVTQAEYEFYETLCDLIERAYAYPTPDAYIFVECSPEVCLARMQARAWTYQNPISLEYLAELEKYFAAFQAYVAEQKIPFLQMNSEALDFQSAQGRADAVAQVRAFLEQA
jgi:deoxyadenosine/deoxycytidine kinase